MAIKGSSKYYKRSVFITFTDDNLNEDNLTFVYAHLAVSRRANSIHDFRLARNIVSLVKNLHRCFRRFKYLKSPYQLKSLSTAEAFINLKLITS